MIRDILHITTPFLLAALGGLFTEIAGTLNIALEGLMLSGAFAAIIVLFYTGSLLAGIVAAVASAVFLSYVLSLVSLKLKANVFIAGLAINLLAVGITIVISTWLFDTKGVIALTSFSGLKQLHIPGVKNIPVLSQILSGHTGVTYASWFFLGFGYFILRKTQYGLTLRATGLDPQIVTIRGKNPDTYRITAFIISGALCGIAGASLSLDLAAYVPNITAGRGWIALVAVFLGFRKPFGVAAACLLFAGAEYLTIAAQGSFNVPRTITLAFPYLITLISLVVVSIVRLKKRHLSAG